MFEIQVQKNGVWMVDSLFDNLDLAAFEAQRLEDSTGAVTRIVDEEKGILASCDGNSPEADGAEAAGAA